MFQSTLRRRDPEAWVRWVVAVLLVGLGFGATAVVVGFVAVLKMLWTLLLLLFGFTPASQPNELLHVVIEEVEFEELEIEQQEWNLAEPSELIGEAPAPPSPEPVAALEMQPMSRSERLASKVELLGVLGALNDSGGFADVLMSSDMDIGSLEGFGGVSGIGVASAGAGLGSVGSGGGGRGEGRIGRGGGGTGGGVLVNRIEGSADILAGGTPKRVRATSAQLPVGDTARCVVKIDPAESEPLQVRGCASSLWPDARAAVRSEGLGSQQATVRVTLTGTSE